MYTQPEADKKKKNHPAPHPKQSNKTSYDETRAKILHVLNNSNEPLHQTQICKKTGIKHRRTVHRHLFGDRSSKQKDKDIREGLSQMIIIDKHRRVSLISQADRIEALKRRFASVERAIEIKTKGKRAEELEAFFGDKTLVFFPRNRIGNKPQYDLLVFPKSWNKPKKDFVEHLYKTLRLKKKRLTVGDLYHKNKTE